MAGWLTLRVVSNSVKCSAKMVDHIYYLMISIPVLLKPKQKFCSRISPRKFFITTFFKTLINLFNKKFILGWAEESILIQRKNPVSSTNKRSVFKLIWCRSCFLASYFNEFRSKPCGKLCVSNNARMLDILHWQPGGSKVPCYGFPFSLSAPRPLIL